MNSGQELNNFIEILDKRSLINKDEKLFTFLSGDVIKSVTFFELDQKVKKLAYILNSMKLKGERALLLYPPGLDYVIGFFGCLYSEIIAVPIFPPDPSNLRKTLPRLQAIIKDADAKIAFSTREIIDSVKDWKNALENEKLNSSAEFENIFNLHWFSTDDIEFQSDFLQNIPLIDKSSIAYLQYTSGSTGNPKGVKISHGNLIHNTKIIYHGFGLDDNQNYEGVIWLPIYHDMGLVGGILEPIFAGFHCNLLPPTDFLKRPLKWLQTISDIENKKIISGGPNFAYELCVKASTPQKREKLNLSNWEIAFTGAEPVRSETIKEFSEAFEISGFSKKAFYPCYGLAEATLIVSGSHKLKGPCEISVDKELFKQNKVKQIEGNELNKFSLVGSGSKILDCEFKIVDPNTFNECSEKEIGEIWTKSESNSIGYWNKPEISKEIFNAFINNSNEGPFTRTGDLGFILKKELFITGRIKDLIIIRGTNHYPQDIELTIEKSHELIRTGSVAAFSCEFEDEEQLIIVAEVREKQNINWDEIAEIVKTSILMMHGILPYKIIFIKSKTIQKTSSGKIQRNANKQAFINDSLDIVYSWPRLDNLKETESVNSQISNFVIDKKSKEEIIQFIAAKLSKELNIPSSKINFNKPLNEYGFDSAKSLILVGELEEFTNKNLDPTLLWNYPTINKLSEFLSANGKNIVQNDKSKLTESNENFSDLVASLSDKEAEELLLKKLSEL